MTRRNPEEGRNSPLRIRALYESLQQSVVPTVTTEERQSDYGKRWLLTNRRELTTTQGTYYLYIENPTSDNTLDVEGASIYTTGSIDVDIYDEPTLDSSQFSIKEFRNTRSSITRNPPWNAYEETGNNVTIDDMGRLFSQDRLDTGNNQNLGAETVAPLYKIDPESSVILSISNNNGSDIMIALNVHFHESVNGPELTTLDGTN